MSASSPACAASRHGPRTPGSFWHWSATFTTALDTPEHIREVVQAVDSAWVRANFDPVNLLADFSMLWHNADAMRHMWQTLGQSYARSAHIKDVRADPEFVVHISEAAPGEGLLDLDAFFEVVGHLGEDTAVIRGRQNASSRRSSVRFAFRSATLASRSLLQLFARHW